MARWAAKNGICMPGFRSLWRMVSEEQIERVQKSMQRCNLGLAHGIRAH